MSCTSILSLPLHVLQAVLCRLKDADSLMSAVCSHSLFYQALKEHEDRISEAVSSREVSSRLYPFALAAFSIQSKPFDVTYLHNVLYDLQYRILNFPSRGTVNFKCQASLHSASYISKLHRSVRYFTHHVSRDALDRAGVDLILERDFREVPSDTEIFVIRRALYRFQILCEIIMACSKVRASDGLLPRGVFTNAFIRDLLLGPFPPWVNEQLACVHDILGEFLFQKLERVVKHDIEWGARNVPCSSIQNKQSYARGLLTYGLLYLNQVHATTQYDEIREALHSKPLASSSRGIDRILTCSYTCRDRHGHEHHRLLRVRAIGRDGWWNVAKRKYLQVWKLYCERMNAVFPLDDDFKQEQDLIKHPSTIGIRIHQIDRPSQYPFQIWFQAHEHVGIADCSYTSSLSLVRLCGYVFWDEPQDEINEMRMEEQIEHLQNISGTHSSEMYRHERKEAKSWAARVETYRKGGRGYWSEDGIHRIEWTGELVDEDGIAKLRNDFIDVTIPKEPKEPKEPRRRRYRPATTE